LVFPVGSTSIQCDAAVFSLNVTRGWLPSELELEFDGQPFQGMFLESYPHDTTGVYATNWWGLATIEKTFTTPIKASNLNFTISVQWNQTISPGIHFDVIFDAIKYRNTTTYSYYTLEINNLPSWNVSFPLDQSEIRFNNWRLEEFWFFVPDDWTVNSLFVPNGEDLNWLVNTTFENDLGLQSKIVKVKNDSVFGLLPANGDGNYSLTCQSENYLKKCALNLVYDSYSWENNGFMRGDNISAEVWVSDSKNKFIQDTGNASLFLYNTTGNVIADFNDQSIDVNTTHSIYKFNQQKIFESDQSTPLGTYSVVAKWLNGDQAGIILRQFYLNNYTTEFIDIVYENQTKSNQIWGMVNSNNVKTDLGDYNFFIYAIENMTGISNPNTLVEANISQSLPNSLVLEKFSQNETVLNPGEQISVKLGIRNINTTLTWNVSITARIIMYQRHEWIVTESDSVWNILESAGDPNEADANIYEVLLDIPEMDEGFNSPIRFAPMAIELQIKIHDTVIKTISHVNLNSYGVDLPLFYYTNTTDATFEGRVLDVVEFNDRTSQAFISNIPRENMRLPGVINYHIQISNDYLMTMNYEYFQSRYEKVDGQIAQIKIVQPNYRFTDVVNITGIAQDEYGNPLSSVSLNLMYQDTKTKDWSDGRTVSGATAFSTLVDGTFNFQMPLSQLPRNIEQKLQIKFAGNISVREISSVFDFNIPLNNANISIVLTETSFYVGSENIIDVSVRNVGNATLKSIFVSVSDSDFDLVVIEGIDHKKDLLKPGESYLFQIKFYVKVFSGNYSNFTINIGAFNVDMSEIYNTSKFFDFKVYRINDQAILKTFVLILFFGGIALLWVFGVLYIMRRISEINQAPTSLTEQDQKPKEKRRAGKYVKIAELQRKQVENDENSSNQTSSTSLDDLIKEEQDKS
jgi:hypothetical protein